MPVPKGSLSLNLFCLRVSSIYSCLRPYTNVPLIRFYSTKCLHRMPKDWDRKFRIKLTGLSVSSTIPTKAVDMKYRCVTKAVLWKVRKMED